MDKPLFIKIIYKSGCVHYLQCEEFNVKKRGAEISSIDWDLSDNSLTKQILHIGLNEIAAIFVVDEKDEK